MLKRLTRAYFICYTIRNKEIKMKFLCKMNLHRYELRKQQGVNDYYECKDCGARIYRKRYGFSGYSPIDWDWLKESNNVRYGSNTGPR